MTLAEEIAALHLLVERAEDACHSGEAAFYRFRLAAVEDERDAEERRAHRRQLERDLARCLHAADADGAAVVRAAIDRFERGQS